MYNICEVISIINPEYKRITLKDNTQMELIVIQPQNPIGIMQILHGMSEHIDRYINVAHFFSQLGYLVIMHNQRGHGKQIEESLRGHFDSIIQLVDDAYEIFKTFQHPGRTILLGHSMGSIIARKYITRYPEVFSDCILVGTGYYDMKYRSSIKLLESLIKIHGETKILKSVNQMSARQFNKKFKPLRTESDWLSLNPDNVDAFVRDPYCGFNVSLQVMLSIAECMGETQKSKSIKLINPDTNLLFVSGMDDPFSNYGKGIHKLAKKYKKFGVDNVTVQLYARSRHEVLNEVNQQEVLNNIGKWLKRNE